jgi:hypothetical protein
MSAVVLHQHADEHCSKGPVLLAVDQEFGEGRVSGFPLGSWMSVSSQLVIGGAPPRAVPTSCNHDWSRCCPFAAANRGWFAGGLPQRRGG